jgi:hypothetical protein
MIHTYLAIAAVLFEATQGSVAVKVESETNTIDPARSIFLRVEVKSSSSDNAPLPDLRERVEGFSLAEDFNEEPRRLDDGSVVKVSNWRLVPEPCANVYRIRPFVVGNMVAGPIYFSAPSPRDPVTGDMECSPKKDLPPLSWKLAGIVSAILATLAGLVYLLLRLIRLVARKVKEHRMSPIERAWVELERLLGKGLPSRGRYKDFYVELTMVVRRYVQRKYGIKAPHLTTEEFLREFRDAESVGKESLARFLESADMVKFAGVEATIEMANDATESARGYLKGDSAAGRAS